MLYVIPSIKRRVCFRLRALQERVWRWIKPPVTSLVPATFADLTRGKAELLAENALLRHQLIILHRQIKRPVYRKTDRVLLVLLARMVRTWKQALFIVQPETLLRWHRELFCVFWKHKSKARSKKPRLSLETISLIKEMAANNRLWGAERIRGEFLKLDIRVSKRTIQKYMRHVRPKRARGQNWKTFLRNGQTPTYLIRDNDRKFGPHFARVATTSGIKVLRTPYRTPQANAICERFLGSVRRECLDHFFIFHEKQIFRLLQAYAVYFNQARPHQGIRQRIPDPPVLSAPASSPPNQVIAVPVLGGLHHHYQRAA